ncbi:MAG: PQQ-binding-like beta-propeller repeat protein [Deltaproteobacteria bacterium]|nr:PQQ-binding-like beta-propeller repeat protein [Deltaproteobacteria bacterium]
MNFGKFAILVAALSFSLTYANAQPQGTPDWGKIARKAAAATDSELSERDSFEVKRVPQYAVKETASYKTGSSVMSSPAVAKDGTLVVGSYDGSVYFLKSDGKKKTVFESELKDWQPRIGDSLREQVPNRLKQRFGRIPRSTRTRGPIAARFRISFSQEFQRGDQVIRTDAERDGNPSQRF